MLLRECCGCMGVRAVGDGQWMRFVSLLLGLTTPNQHRRSRETDLREDSLFWSSAIFCNVVFQDPPNWIGWWT